MADEITTENDEARKARELAEIDEVMRAPEPEIVPQRMVDFISRMPKARKEAPVSAVDIERVRVAERRKNLVTSRYRNAEALAVIPPARVPPVLAGHSGSAKAFELAREFLKTPSMLLCTMWGNTGTGKSWGAAWIAAATPGALWLQASSCRATDGQWAEIARQALRVDLLIVNDLGAEPLVPWQNRRMPEILEQRFDDGLRSVITTNLRPRWSKEELAKRSLTEENHIAGRYGDRLAGRILDAKFSINDFCGGADIRERQR